MIEKFEHVTAETKANVYFDGKVISHTLWLADGEKRTLGIFMPGAYEFGTADAEIMDLTGGECEVQLPGSDEWKYMKAGEAFKVPANSKYGLRCYVPVQYICAYVKE